MITYFYELAGCVVRVSGDRDILYQEHDLLENFRTNPQNWHRSIHCAMTDNLPEPAGELVFTEPGRMVFRQQDAVISYIGCEPGTTSGAYIWVRRKGNESQALFHRQRLTGEIPAKLVLAALEPESLVVGNGGFLLHAACIAYREKAILFTAPSGTGKSTQADLWKKYRGAEIINGDRIMVRPTSTGCEAIGVPFSGSSGIRVNRTLPVAAIVCIRQAPVSKANRIRGLKAFRNIWEGCSLHVWNRQDIDACAGFVEEVIRAVPVLTLDCTPDEEAIIALEQIFSEERMQW